MSPRRYTLEDRLAVRDAHPIEVAVGKRVGLKKRGRVYLGLCPFHNEKTPSFKVDPQLATFHCFGCSAHGDVVEWEMRIQRVDYPEAMRRLLDDAGFTKDTQAAHEAAERRREWERKLEREAAERRRREADRARRIWEQTEEPGDLVATYFRSRGLTLPPSAFRKVLRFHPALRYWVEDQATETGVRLIGLFPAVVGLIQDCRTLQPIGVHLTYLGADGRKLAAADPVTGEILDARKIRGGRDGGAIMLVKPTGDHLGIGEGWETCLSVLQASVGLAPTHRLHRLPVWAGVSLGNLGGGALGRGPLHPDPDRAALGQRLPSTTPDPARPGVVPPPGVRFPVLLEDGDSADLAAAECDGTRAINRWTGMGCRPLRFRAPVGMDFNDMVKGEAK